MTVKIKKFAGKDTVESLNQEIHVANRIRNMNDSVMKDVDRIHAAIAGDCVKSASAISTMYPPIVFSNCLLVSSFIGC